MYRIRQRDKVKPKVGRVSRAEIAQVADSCINRCKAEAFGSPPGLSSEWLVDIISPVFQVRACCFR
jgi:hypothetical protein